MNAAVQDAPTRRPRRIDNRERSILEGELGRWGKWVEEHSDFTGHPRADAIAAWLDGAGGGQRGHRVLCLEMPTEVYATNGRIIRLPDRQREAVFAKYVCSCTQWGQLVTDDQRAAALGISREAFGMLLTRARLAILGISEDA